MKKVILFKKFLSFFLIISLFSNFIVPSLNAVDTNWTSTPWTLEKATHLAKRVLIWPNPDIIQTLYEAWSAQAAVNILFPSVNWPDRTTYETELETFKWASFNPSDTNQNRRVYAFKYYRDPYEAKMKLFWLFEDIFAIDRTGGNADQINFPDVDNHFKILFEESLWNYKQMVKRVLFDTVNPENSFAMWKYLDLLNQPDKNNPNENYARELLQLFLMGEYKPWEDGETPQDIRNYTEEDVAALALILTWFRAWNDKKVYFDNAYHNTYTSIKFLSWSLKLGDNFSFYNSASWTINNTQIINPISWNNWLADNIIDYIFSKRESEIAYFLAWRLLKYYVSMKPTRDEIETLASKIISNNFDLYPTVKWLLASDIMYSDKSMNELRYKNPIELAIWTLKLLHYKNPSVIDSLLQDTTLLTNLDWIPYNPRSIFGRDWFDDNKAFMNGYFHNQWVTYTSKIAFTSWSNYYDLVDLLPITKFINSWTTPVKTSTLNTYSWSINLKDITISLNENIFQSWTINTITFATWVIVLPEFYIETFSWRINLEWTFDATNGVLNMSSWTFLYWTWSYSIINSSFLVDTPYLFERDITIDEMIMQFEDYLYFWFRLPNSVKNDIKEYLLKDYHWNNRTFLPNDTNYRNKYIKAVIAVMLSQAEFLLLSWNDLPQNSENSWNIPISNNSKKLIMIELYWWYDWMNWVIPKSDFSYYQNIRWEMAIRQDNLIDLGSVYLNKNLESLKPFFDSGDLRIVNRVWTPSHSRAHDTAAIQVASRKASKTFWTPWLIWELIKNETNPLNHIVLWTNKPPIYTNWKYINIWWNSILYKNNIFWTTNIEKTHQINFLKNTFKNRTLYPDSTKSVFLNSMILDDVWNSWQSSFWYTLASRLNFTKSLIDNSVGITYYIPGWGWYDTHEGQLKSWVYNLNDRTRDLAIDITNFFTQAKLSWKDVTIVVYSEFWRTLKTNGTLWTDHGQWWGYFILSTNNSLKQAIPDKIIWKLFPEKEYNDWFWVWIDYRSIYSKILTSLYNIDVNNYFLWEYKLEDDLNITLPNPVFLRREFKHSNSNFMNTEFKFKFEDKNMRIKDWSYLKFYYWQDPNNLTQYSKWQMDNYALQEDGSFKINLNLRKNLNYYYKLEIVDNQYDSYIASWNFIVPEKYESNSPNIIIPLTSDSLFAKYNNTLVSGDTNISKLVLYNNPVEIITNSWVIIYSWSVKNVSFSSGITMTFGTWETSISTLTNSWIWNWWFIIPKFINKNEFLSEDSIFGSNKLKELNIENILKVWADTLWVWMKLNQNVIFTLPINNQNSTYKVLTSEDWLNWREIQNVTKSGNNIIFSTNHFSYFAIYDATQIVVNPPLHNDNNNWWNKPSDWSNWNDGNSWWSSWRWWGGGWVFISIDYCPNWDNSLSYYDRSCWEIVKKEIVSIVQKDKKYYQNIKKQILADRLKAKIKAEKKQNAIKKVKFFWYELVEISNYSFSETINKLSKLVINSNKFSKKQKQDFITRFNEYLLARYNYILNSKDRILKNKYNKQLILFRSTIKKLNKL